MQILLYEHRLPTVLLIGCASMKDEQSWPGYGAIGSCFVLPNILYLASQNVAFLDTEMVNSKQRQDQVEGR